LDLNHLILFTFIVPVASILDLPIYYFLIVLRFLTILLYKFRLGQMSGYLNSDIFENRYHSPLE